MKLRKFILMLLTAVVALAFVAPEAYAKKGKGPKDESEVYKQMKGEVGGLYSRIQQLSHKFSDPSFPIDERKKLINELQDDLNRLTNKAKNGKFIKDEKQKIQKRLENCREELSKYNPNQNAGL